MPQNLLELDDVAQIKVVEQSHIPPIHRHITHEIERLAQLQAIAAEDGDNAECARDDIFKEFGEAYG